MGKYDTLNQTDIEDTFNELIEANGQTTSKEVKDKLRNQGFWSTQAIVGAALRDIALAAGNDWDFNGVYRTYYEPNTQMSPTSASPNLISVKQKKQPLDPQDREPVDQPETGDWRCSDVNSSGQLYFESKLTAPQARYAYSLVTGVNYVDIRSTRVQ